MSWKDIVKKTATILLFDAYHRSQYGGMIGTLSDENGHVLALVNKEGLRILKNTKYIHLIDNEE